MGRGAEGSRRVCTVIIEVPESAAGAVRLLAVRDEDPGRAWDAPGRWWPELPSVLGVRDRVAGGAWLAASPENRRLALVLNRADTAGLPEGPSPTASRGALVLDAVRARPIPNPPRTANFNLLGIEGSRASLTVWDGAGLARRWLEPGLHMIAHHDVDDAERTPRIARWLPAFRELGGLPDHAWRQQWIALLDETAGLRAGDDRAIIRDNRGHGYATLSLLVCLAEVRGAVAGVGVPGGAGERPAPALRLDSAVLDEPARWASPAFSTIVA